jgi:hypothetical protein
MWLSDKTKCLIEEFVSSELTNEIIIIDNNNSNSIELDNSLKKIKIIKNKKNIYVNPSWNLGVELSQNDDIIISNDDLCIKKVDRILKKIKKSKFDLIGLNLENINKSPDVIIDRKEGPMKKGFGCFFYIRKKKYQPIDNDIKIWYGDNILHDSISNKGIISFNEIDIELSKTVKSTNNLIEILENDKNVYRRKYKN